MKKRKLIVIMLVILAAALTGGGCKAAGGNDIPEASREIFAMDTFMTVTCYGERCEEALDAAEEEILRLDALLSVGSPESEISRLNASGSAILSDDTAAMTEEALKVWEQTGGSFDITVYPLMELWGFTTKDYRISEAEDIEETLETVGSGLLDYDPDTKELVLSDGQEIDLGGIAKGYCSDRLTEIFDEYGLDAALVSLGGNVVCYHTKPDGSLWKCGIRNPFEPDNMDELAGVVSLSDSKVITSGAYERYFIGDDGKTYHHILDPHTGYSADSGLVSASIVSADGTLADALSTAVFVMGLEKSAAYWRENGADFDMILVTEDGDVYITEPLKDVFTTEAPLHIISKEE